MTSHHYMIEVVIADSGWILEKIASEIRKSAFRSAGDEFQVQIVAEASGRADLTYFLPYSIYRPVPGRISGAFFSHQEEEPAAQAHFLEAARTADFAVVMAERYGAVLRDAGARVIHHIPTGVDLDRFCPKLRLGVVGRVYSHTNRKGEHLLAPLAGMPEVELHFTGDGWPGPGTYYRDDEMPDFYNSIDYLLIPSLIEGGPVPLHEALACGKPVIAPDVGFVPDYPHIPFQRGDAQDLRRAVEECLAERRKLRSSVEHLGWQACGDRHVALFRELLGSVEGKAGDSGPAVPEVRPLRVSLVVHSGEIGKSHGGPTSRSHQIRDTLRKSGIEIEIHQDIEAARGFAPDVVHVFNSWPLAGSASTLAGARKLGVPVVYSPIALNLGGQPVFRDRLPFELTEDSDFEAVFAKAGAEIAAAMRTDGATPPAQGIDGQFDALRSTTRLADKVITLSQAEENFLHATDADTVPLSRVANGVDAARMAAGNPKDFQKTFGLERYILCVGRIEPRKNQAALALAAKGLDAPLVLIGHSGNDFYLNLVRSLGDDRLVLIDRIEDRDLLASAYKGAQVFTLPSWCEGAPLAAIEAGAAGTPLILSNLSSEPEYFEGFADYVAPGDIAGLRACLARALDAPDGPERRAERSDFVCSRYSIERHAEETLGVYRKAVEAAAAEAGRPGRHYLDITQAYGVARHGIEVTGIPQVEVGVIDAALRAGHTDFIAWDMGGRRFFPIDLTQGTETELRHQLAAIDPSHETRTIVTTQIRPRPAIPVRRAKVAARSLIKRSEALVSDTLRRLPAGAGMPVFRALRAMKHSLMGSQDRKLAELGAPLRTDRNTLPRFQVSHDVSTQGWLPSRGDRITILGHSWQGHDDYLTDLASLLGKVDVALGLVVYDLASFQAPTTVFSGHARQQQQRRLSTIIPMIDVAHATSPSLARELADLTRALSHDCRITTVRLGDSKPPSRAKPVRGLEPARYVLLVSSLTARKNQDLIVEVWSSILPQLKSTVGPDIQLVLAGTFQGGSGEYRAKEAQDILAKSNIRVLGAVSDAELGWLYQNCVLTLYPSVFEGWGLPVIESLRHGKICLASTAVPAAVEVSNGAIVRLSPHDFFAWRKALLAFLVNASMREAFEAEAAKYEPVGYDGMVRTILEGA